MGTFGVASAEHISIRGINTSNVCTQINHRYHPSNFLLLGHPWPIIIL